MSSRPKDGDTSASQRGISQSATLPTQAARTPLHRNVWVVTLTSFLTDISSEMLTTLLPLFMANVLGVPFSIVGLIEGIAETTASLMKVFSGWLSDRLGQRKWLTVGGYALSTLAKTMLYWADSWSGVLVSRFGERLGKGVRTAPRDALLADSITAEQRGLAFGLNRAGDTAGAVLGLLAALTVIWFAQGDSTLLTRPLFQTLVLLSLIPATLAVLVLAIGAQEIPMPKERRPLLHLTLAPFDARFRRFVLVVVVFALGNSSDAFLVLRAQAAGLTLVGILGMMILFNIIYAALSEPAGALSDRLGRQWLMIAGWLLYALVYLGFARITMGWQAWALMAVYGIYYALTDGVAKAFVADLVPAMRRGTAYGIFNAAIGIMALPASLLAGILWQGVFGWSGFGPSAPFYFGALMALVAVVLLIRFDLERAAES